MIIKKYFLISITAIGLLFLTLQLSAQNTIVVSGKVVEESTGQPVPGVTVAEKNKESRQVNATTTDINGNYQIKISDTKDSLYFTQIGMKGVVKAVNNLRLINVKMSDDIQGLEEVSIKSTGTKRSDGFLGISEHNRSDSRVVVNMKALEDVPAASIDQLLQGQASGLLISMNSGNPGSGSSMQIRGAASIGLGTKPLIVVDDVPLGSGVAVDLSNPDAISELINIAPADIASVEILKDAAATAVYGSSGANGVIYIKTKRGDNQKPRVSINSTTTLKTPQTPIPLLNGDQYKTVMLEGIQNRFGTGVDLTTSDIANLFLQPGALNFENYNNNTDWQKEATMPLSFTQQVDAAISGGGESAKYSVSVGDRYDVGPLRGTTFNRLTTRFNFDYTISDRLSFKSDISYSDGKTNSYYDNNINNVIIKAPILPVYTQDQNGNDLSSYFMTTTGGFQANIRNPIALIDNAFRVQDNQTLTAALTVAYAPFKGLGILNTFSTTNQSVTNETFLPHSATGVDFYRRNNSFLVLAAAGDNSLNFATSNPQKSFRIFYKNSINYSFKLPVKYSLKAGVYTTFESTTASGLDFRSVYTPSFYLAAPYNSQVLNTLTSNSSLNRKLSFIGMANFSFDNRYGVQGAINREGNSAFGENNRWGLFPTISGYWSPAYEPLIRNLNLTWLDDWKFRASWGLTGRAPNVSSANAFTYSANSPFIDIQGVTPDQIKLVDLRWEKTTTINFGMDASLWKGRLNFTADYSVNTTRDLILTAPVSPTSGFDNISTNFGTIRGNTIDISIGGDAIRNKNWTIGGSFNITTQTNTVVSLPNNAPVIRASDLDNGLYMTLINVGDPIGSFYGLKSLGVYKTDADAFAQDAQGNFIKDLNGNKIPMRWNTQNGDIFTGGDAHYADLNHDGIINKQDVTALGNTTPKFYGGLVLNVKHKAWGLITVFNYRYRFDIINYTMATTTNMFSYNNQSTGVLRRWRKQGDDTNIPRALYGAGHNWVGSDRYVEEGTFARLNSIVLTYSLSKSLLTLLNIKSAKFAFSVNNLATFTNYTGADPTVSTNVNDPFAAGGDRSVTPTPIQYSLGVNVSL